MNHYLVNFFKFPADWKMLLWRSPFGWVIPALLLLLALWLLYPTFKRMRAERRVRDSIARLGKISLRDVSLDNGMDGFVFIDYLVLTTKEILVVTLINARGIVFGGEKIDSWARVVGRRTHKFPNPLEPNEERVLAVKFHVPDVEVRGVVLFDEGSTFPKGKPENVVLPQEITTPKEQWEQATIPAPLQMAWNRLTDLGRAGAETYSRDVLLLRGKPSYTRDVIAAALLLVAITWSGWHLLA